MAQKRVHIWVSGRVQGVCFRQFTLKNAGELGVKGWVKNLLDGKVEAVFEGESHSIDKLIRLCGQGPSFGRVEHLELMKEAYKDEFENFKITY